MLSRKIITLLYHSIAITQLLSQNHIGRSLDSQRMEFMVLRDTAQLSQRISDHLLYIHSLGFTESKSEHLTNISSGIIEYDSFQFQQSSYIKAGNLILGQGIVRVIGKYKGAPFDVQLYFSNRYRKIKSRYFLEYWQSTKQK